MKLPWTCDKCGTHNYHYGVCSCPDGRLKMVAAERDAMKDKSALLDIIEAQALAAIAAARGK